MSDFLERRRYFESYGSRASERRAQLPPRGIRSSCPCCGYPTLGGRGGYEICELCWWEDDGTDDEEAEEVKSGPNHSYSLAEARENFTRYLVKYPPDRDRRIDGPDSDEVREVKRHLIEVFDRMLEEPSAEELDALWKEVARHERALKRSLK
jgi:hypothetical protein